MSVRSKSMMSKLTIPIACWVFLIVYVRVLIAIDPASYLKTYIVDSKIAEKNKSPVKSMSGHGKAIKYVFTEN